MGGRTGGMQGRRRRGGDRRQREYRGRASIGGFGAAPAKTYAGGGRRRGTIDWSTERGALSQEGRDRVERESKGGYVFQEKVKGVKKRKETGAMTEEGKARERERGTTATKKKKVKKKECDHVGNNRRSACKGREGK